jgi:hypothetical protein
VYGAALVDAIATEDASTRYPQTTRRVAALAEQWLPVLDARRVQEAVDAEVHKRVEAWTASQQPSAMVVPLRPAQTSDGLRRTREQAARERVDSIEAQVTEERREAAGNPHVPAGIDPAVWERAWRRV